MKKSITVILLILIAMVCVPKQSDAQLPVLEVIKAGIKKAIKALDLKVQRLQNQTIWLQNAQKVLENTLSKVKLDDISDWAAKQKTLYQQYFDELATVKSYISMYQRVRGIAQKQAAIIQNYQQGWSLFKSDKHFTPGELEYMAKVYSGILAESAKNVDQLLTVVSSFKTQMSDAKRLEIINDAGDRVDQNYSDLVQFNQQNKILSLTRSQSKQEAAAVMALYGLQ